MSDKIIKDNTRNDLEAMEAFDMAVGISPKNDVWVCSVCGYMYEPNLGDESQGILPGTSFEDIPDDWHCPVCYAPKSAFEPKVEINVEGEESWTNS